MQRRTSSLIAGWTLALACAGSAAAEPPARQPAAAQAPAYHVEVRGLTPQPALTIRAQVAPAELEARMKELMPRLVSYAMTNGIELAGPPFVRYFERSAERIDFEAGIPTRKAQPGNAALGITAGELPAGSALITEHRGAYQRLPEAHAALARYARARGLRPSGAGWEVFQTNPVQERDPSRWRTYVFLPLAR